MVGGESEFYHHNRDGTYSSLRLTSSFVYRSLNWTSSNGLVQIFQYLTLIYRSFTKRIWPDNRSLNDPF